MTTLDFLVVCVVRVAIAALVVNLIASDAVTFWPRVLAAFALSLLPSVK